MRAFHFRRAVLRALNPGVAPREAWAWAMYDFANSGYTTVVITAVFNAYFVARVADNADWGSLAWSAALAVSNLAVILTAPALGAYADRQRTKKRLLALTTLGCVLSTAGLAGVGPGDLVLAMALVALSHFFFGSGENLIAAFLPELARGRGFGRLSGWGWALGYVGGLLCLGLCLAYVAAAQARGLSADAFVPGTMWITAGVFLLASLPTFLFLRERGRPESVPPPPASSAWRRFWASLAGAAEYPDLRRFLLCIVFYQAGVQAVIALAAVYAQQAMGFGARESIELILVVNVTAALGALAFGQVQDRLGHKPTLTIVLAGWLLTVWLAYIAVTPGLFWLAANVAGLCLGASQSAGRALVAYLSPVPRRAEFFGLWGAAVKLSAILGPLTYGLAVWLAAGEHRLAMLVLGGYFVIGLALLAGVDVRRGRRLAHAAAAHKVF